MFAMVYAFHASTTQRSTKVLSTERALLADEMGLGKTIQAIAASTLLHRLGKARRVLVVTPASLKTEW